MSGIIRDARPEDAERIAEIYDYYVRNTAITFEYESPSPAEIQRRMARTVRKYPYLVIERDRAVQGYAYGGPFVGRAAYRWSCELSVYVDPAARKGGLGGRLYAALEERLRDMGILNLYACVACPAAEEDEYLDWNSAEFHRHMGFEKAGEFRLCGYKFGRWYNMIWMEKIIGEHRPAQAPIRFSDV